MDYILYHNNCPDGLTAAYIAKKKYPEAEAIGLDHGNPPNYEMLKGKDIIVVDFSWRTREENIQVASDANTFVLLDHHKTAQAVLEGLPRAAKINFMFDMNRSGAGLAWDYLFVSGMCHTPRPWYVDYVEDRDLWRFKLPESKEVNSFIMTFPYTLEGWQQLDMYTLEDAKAAGKFIKLQVDHYVREAAKQVQYGSWLHYKVAVANVPYLNCSEVGNVLAQTADISLTWFERFDGQTQFSLRSIGDVDVSEFAKAMKGGGHKNAAGFQTTLERGRELVDTILKRNLLTGSQS